MSFASSFVNTYGILVFHLIYEFFNQPVNIKDSRLRSTPQTFAKGNTV